jgi:hypothetical protein
MSEPSESEVKRGSSALFPFVQAWGLSLNPENLDLMAYAVLRAVRSDGSLDDIVEMARELIADDRERARRMREAWQRELDDRKKDGESD